MVRMTFDGTPKGNRVQSSRNKTRGQKEGKIGGTFQLIYVTGEHALIQR